MEVGDKVWWGDARWTISKIEPGGTYYISRKSEWNNKVIDIWVHPKYLVKIDDE